MKNQTNNSTAALSCQNRPNDILLSPHFRLNEFLNIAQPRHFIRLGYYR